MIKALKKLKIWSRKKKKHRLLAKESPPPSPYYHFITPSPPYPDHEVYEPLLPSTRKESPPPPPRRPLPPPPYYLPPSPPPPRCPAHSEYEPLLPSAPPLPPWLEYDLQLEETPSTSEVSLEAEASCYQQQHTVSNDDRSITTQVDGHQNFERRDVGCVTSFLVHLLRSVFPCFHIPEETAAKLK